MLKRNICMQKKVYNMALTAYHAGLSIDCLTSHAPGAGRIILASLIFSSDPHVHFLLFGRIMSSSESSDIESGSEAEALRVES